MSQPLEQQPFASSRPRIGWHRVDALSLVVGLLAVGAALVALLDVDVDAGVVLPVLLVLAGVVGLVSAVRRSAG